MAAREHASTHGAAIMVEFQLKIGRAHPRGLPSTLPRPCGFGRSKRHPSEQPQSKHTKRNGNADFTAQSEEHPKTERKQATADFCDARRHLRVDFGNNAERPQNEYQRKRTENEGRHGYFNWVNSICAADERFPDKSARALMPPAA